MVKNTVVKSLLHEMRTENFAFQAYRFSHHSPSLFTCIQNTVWIKNSIEWECKRGKLCVEKILIKNYKRQRRKAKLKLQKRRKFNLSKSDKLTIFRESKHVWHTKILMKMREKTLLLELMLMLILLLKSAPN